MRGMPRFYHQPERFGQIQFVGFRKVTNPPKKVPGKRNGSSLYTIWFRRILLMAMLRFLQGRFHILPFRWRRFFRRTFLSLLPPWHKKSVRCLLPYGTFCVLKSSKMRKRWWKVPLFGGTSCGMLVNLLRWRYPFWSLPLFPDKGCQPSKFRNSDLRVADIPAASSGAVADLWRATPFRRHAPFPPPSRYSPFNVLQNL